MPLPRLISNLPPNPSVTVVFRGLLTFCFDRENSCEIGVLNEFFPNQEHELVFRKWRKAPNCPAAPEMYTRPQHNFRLEVINPLPSVNEVIGIGDATFDRTSATNNRQDLRWMIDFEQDLYPGRRLPKLAAKVNPRMTINKGIFYTHHTTRSKFVAVPETGAGQVMLGGSIAEVMAANIYLQAGGAVEVWIDNTRVDTLQQAAGVAYQLDVFNLCDSNTHADCIYDPGHATDKRRRGDFFMYYNAINKAVPGNGVEEFLLRAIFPLPVNPPPITGICQILPKEHASDPAPCGPGGYGETPPPYG